ncbi:hypothetical protein AMECASPLE_010781 [Ameca splendens]|uniref:C-type lectin domain-containing protein n=1 Tax=Ameca splendens TaxID=208324 RepID=A0ABV1A895_9TELE
MEMQEILTESPNSNEEEGAGEPKVEGKTQEEAEPDYYEKLQCPTENVYVETGHIHPKIKSTEVKQVEGNAGLYRLLCLILTIICLILLILVFVLGVKLQTDSTVCPGNDKSEVQQRPPPTCNLQDCHKQFKRLGCQQCARGWLTFDGSCFFLSTTRLTWPESHKNCSASGGALAVVTSQRIQSFLTEKGKLKYWIGLRKDDSTWNWVNNNELEQSYWKETVQMGDCAYLNSEGPVEKNWDRASCQASTYFICQLQY